MIKHHPAQSLGILDIGSNSTRFVAYDIGAKPPQMFFNEKIITSLGKDLASTGMLYPKGKKSTRKSIKGFLTLADVMSVEDIISVATSASRDAEDGPAFIEKIEKKYGIEIDVISGEEEATLSALGVHSSFKKAKGIVADLGGGSLELAQLKGGKVSEAISLPLGVHRIAAKKKKAKDYVWGALEDVKGPYCGHENLYVVGGSWRSIALAHQIHSGILSPHSHGYTIGSEALTGFCEDIMHVRTKTLSKKYGIEKKRAVMMPYAALSMIGIIEVLNPANVVFSNAGIRDGIVYRYLHQK